MRLQGFAGPTYTSRSPNADAQRAINFFPERVESGHGVNEFYLLGTPGLTVFALLSEKPVKALFGEDSRLFAVAGTGFYEITSAGDVTRYGTMASDANPATITSNGVGGFQLLICSGGSGYIFNLTTSAFQQITDAAAPAVFTMGGFLDGYFVVADTVNNKFHLSDLNNGLSWSGFNVGQRVHSSDPLRAMIIDHREIWFQGEQKTEVWFNSGNASFPFQPVQGTYIEDGTAAPWSLVQLDNSIYWLQADERGAGVAMRANGYTPQRVSDHSTEQFWKKYSSISDAIGYGYQDHGHSFWVLYFPQGDVHWVYDVSVGQWHERAFWLRDECKWIPHMSRCHAYSFAKNLVGDRQSGAIYEMSLDLLTDNVVYPG